MKSSLTQPDLAVVVAAWRGEFDAGRFYEAHEVAENAWHAYRGPDRDFLKGLVQLAVSLHHHHAGNAHGARVKWKSSRQYLAAYPAVHHGLELKALLKRLAVYYAAHPFGQPESDSEA